MDTRFVTGVCRAHYAVILTWHGSWTVAERELLAAVDGLTAKRPHWRAEALAVAAGAGVCAGGGA